MKRNYVADKESLIDFPCRFPIKAMGRDQSEFEAHVLQIISPHVDAITADDISIQASKNGNFLSVTVTVDARDQDHLDRIYRTLTASERVLYVL
jgi:putative lipoic acid-binding regulatory protein